MAARRKNNEGSWGTKTIKGVKYNYFRNSEGKYFYGHSTKDINKKIKEYEKKKKSGDIDNKIEESRKNTFGDEILNWLTEIKSIELKRNTRDGYMHCIEGQIVKFDGYPLGDMQVGIVTYDSILKYYNALTGYYSKSTIKKNRAILSQFIEYGNSKNLFAEYIDVKKIRLPSEDVVAVKRKEIHFLPEEDIKLFCKEANRLNSTGFNFGGKIGEPTYGNNAKLLVFIVFTGVRIGEGIDLIWRNVSINQKIIKIKTTSTSIRDNSDDSNKVVNTSSSPKTDAGYRIVPLCNEAIDILLYEEKLNPNHKDDDYVFITKNGGKIKSRQNVNRTLNNIMSRAGCSVPSCTPHELRHTFGSILLKKGIDIKVVSEILGHSDVSITYNVYIHILQEQKMKAISYLDNILE